MKGPRSRAPQDLPIAAVEGEGSPPRGLRGIRARREASLHAPPAGDARAGVC